MELGWDEIVKYSDRILSLTNQLLKETSKKKIVETIKAKGIRGINQQNFGVLIKHILPDVKNERIKSKEVWFTVLKKASNNTAKGVYNTFPDIIDVLEKMKTNLGVNNNSKKFTDRESIYQNLKYGISKNIEESQEFFVDRKYLGFYNTYTHSVERPHIIKKPLLIKKNPFDESLEVLWGNESSERRHKGVILRIGTDIMCMLLYDFYKNISEIVQINLSISNVSNPSLLRGSYTSKGISGEPACGRIVLVKMSGKNPEKDFKKAVTINGTYKNLHHYWNTEHAILQYLKDPVQSYLAFNKSFDHSIGNESLYAEKYWLIEKFLDFDGFMPIDYFEEHSMISPIYHSKLFRKTFPYNINGVWRTHYEIDDSIDKNSDDYGFNCLLLLALRLERMGDRIHMQSIGFAGQLQNQYSKGKGYIIDDTFSLSFISHNRSGRHNQKEKIEVGSFHLKMINKNTLKGKLVLKRLNRTGWKSIKEENIVLNRINSSLLFTSTLFRGKIDDYFVKFNSFYIHCGFKIDCIEKSPNKPKLDKQFFLSEEE